MHSESLINDEIISKKRTSRRASIAILLCMLACILMFVLQILIAVVINFRFDEIGYLYTTIAIYVVDIVLPFALISFIFNKFFHKEKIYLSKQSLPKPLLYISGTIGVGYIINLLVTIILPDVVDFHSSDTDFVPTSAYGICLYFISNAILPALLEEWAFRGIICKNLLPYGKKGAIVFSAILFSVMHLNPVTMIFTFAIGVLLGIAYEYTGSLKIPIIIHFINNGYACLMTVTQPTENEISDNFLLLSLLFYVFIVCGIVALAYYGYVNIKKKKADFRKPALLGYQLPLGRFSLRFFLNFGIIPLAFIYGFFYYISYLA